MKNYRSELIDDAGWYFEVEYDDVSRDGSLDLIGTTWSRRDEFGQTVAYELKDADWRIASNWKKHSIFDRFPKFANQGFGSPGFSFLLVKAKLVSMRLDYQKIHSFFHKVGSNWPR